MVCYWERGAFAPLVQLRLADRWRRASLKVTSGSFPGVLTSLIIQNPLVQSYQVHALAGVTVV